MKKWENMNDREFEALIKERTEAAGTLKRGFGDGWMSKKAQDMIRLAIFAGFDKTELIRRVIRLGGSKVQERQVLDIMDIMSAEEEAEEEAEFQAELQAGA